MTKDPAPSPAQILSVIEVIAEHAMGMEDTPENRALSNIYRYAHIAWTRCPHPEWDKAFWEDYKSMLKSKMFDEVTP